MEKLYYFNDLYSTVSEHEQAGIQKSHPQQSIFPETPFPSTRQGISATCRAVVSPVSTILSPIILYFIYLLENYMLHHYSVTAHVTACLNSKPKPKP